MGLAAAQVGMKPLAFQVRCRHGMFLNETASYQAAPCVACQHRILHLHYIPPALRGPTASHAHKHPTSTTTTHTAHTCTAPGRCPR